jgi:prepilin-type N-terminal cleavage/methylation domain-containing protein
MRHSIQALLLHKNGFTLIELVIVMALVSILSISILGFFQNQRRMYTWEDQKLERDQNLRTALNLITQELKLAGFCVADEGLAQSLDLWVPSRFVPTYPLKVTLDANPKVTLGDDDQPDMLTFACVIPTELNPTTSMEITNGNELVLALNKSNTKKQYRVGDVLQIGYLPEYAIVRGINGRKLTVDTDPLESGFQPLKMDYPEHSFVGEIYIVSYAVFNEKNDPQFKRHAANRPELKRKVNAGGFHPVADNIADMRIITAEDGRIQVTLTAKTESPNHQSSNINGICEVTGDIFIRNTRNVQTATTCLKPADPKNLALHAGLNEDYPCRILMAWESVNMNEKGEGLSELGCPVIGYRVFFDVAAGVCGYYVDVDIEAKNGFVLDVNGIPSAGFFISVAAKNSGGIGTRSGEISIFDTMPPEAPSSLHPKATAPHQITLSWKDSAGCDLAGYYIYRKTPTENYKTINAHIVRQGAEEYVDEGLVAGNTYTYVMKAMDFAFNPSDRTSAVTILLPE